MSGESIDGKEDRSKDRPLGMLQFMVLGGGEDVCPVRETLWDLLVRYDLNHSRAVSLMPR